MKLAGWAVPARCVLVLVWLLLWRLSQADHPIVTISRQHKGDMFAAEGKSPSYLLKIHISFRTFHWYLIVYVFHSVSFNCIQIYKYAFFSSFHPFAYLLFTTSYVCSSIIILLWRAWLKTKLWKLKVVRRNNKTRKCSPLFWGGGGGEGRGEMEGANMWVKLLSRKNKVLVL
jgi:hypothetical protein